MAKRPTVVFLVITVEPWLLDKGKEKQFKLARVRVIWFNAKFNSLSVLKLIIICTNFSAFPAVYSDTFMRGCKC